MNRNRLRLLALSAVLALLMGLCAPALADPDLKGDVNLDGWLNDTDLTMLREYIVGIRNLSGQALRNADVNGDGSVTSTDVAQLNRKIHCSHGSWTIVGGDEKEVSCTDNGDGTHTQVLTEYIDYRCDDCGYTWSTVENWTLTSDHEYLPGQVYCNICHARKPQGGISSTEVPYSRPAPAPAPRPASAGFGA